MGMTAWANSNDCHFVVAQDGTGDFRTVQEAVNAVPDFRKAGPTCIFIRKGVYKEKLVIPNTKDGVQLYGEDGTVLTYDDYAQKPNVFGENKGTSGSSSVYIYGPNFFLTSSLKKMCFFNCLIQNILYLCVTQIWVTRGKKLCLYVRRNTLLGISV